ncbi:MAG: hypothetical protein NVSMB18_19330 [Acetobacteraceae bacterium]
MPPPDSATEMKSRRWGERQRAAKSSRVWPGDCGWVFMQAGSTRQRTGWAGIGSALAVGLFSTGTVAHAANWRMSSTAAERQTIGQTPSDSVENATLAQQRTQP